MMMRTLKVGRRSALAFSVIVAIVIALGAIALIQMRQLRQSEIEVETDWMPSVRQAGQMTAALLRLRLESLRALGTRDPARQPEMATALVDLRSRFATGVKDYAPLVSSDAEQRLYQAVQDGATAYLGLLDSFETLYRTGDLPGAEALANGGMRAAADQLQTQIENLAALNDRGAVASGIEAGRIYDHGLAWVVGLILATLLATIALAFLLTRSITLPIGEELVITHGALEALNLGLQSLTRPGDLVAVESPAFYASLQVLERLQLKAVEIPVDAERGLNLDALEEALSRLPIKACWFMSGLQNPTGVSLDDSAQQRLYGLLQRHQVPLLEDDVYAELYSGSEPHRPVKRFDRDGLVLHCGSFSKCLAPGYRIGWIAAGRQAGAVARLRLMTTITPSMPAQAALADYLQHGGYDRHLRRLRLSLDRQRQAMLTAARRYFPADTHVSRPQGGYFLWFELPTRVDSLALYRQALAEGISLAPGPIFSAQQGFRHCIRLNCGHPWDARSEAAMARLGELLKAF